MYPLKARVASSKPRSAISEFRGLFLALPAIANRKTRAQRDARAMHAGRGGAECSASSDRGGRLLWRGSVTHAFGKGRSGSLGDVAEQDTAGKDDDWSSTGCKNSTKSAAPSQRMVGMIHYGPQSGKVQWLAAHRDHQGQGHGKSRMSAAIEVAPTAPPPPTARLRRTRAGTERDGLGVGLRRTPILRKSRQLALALPDERPIIQPLSFSLKPAARDRHGGPLFRASCCQLGICLSCLCLSAQAGVLHDALTEFLTLGLAVCCVVCMRQHGGVSVRCLAACNDAGSRSLGPGAPAALSRRSWRPGEPRAAACSRPSPW